MLLLKLVTVFTIGTCFFTKIFNLIIILWSILLFLLCSFSKLIWSLNILKFAKVNFLRAYWLLLRLLLYERCILRLLNEASTLRYQFLVFRNFGRRLVASLWILVFLVRELFTSGFSLTQKFFWGLTYLRTQASLSIIWKF